MAEPAAWKARVRQRVVGAHDSVRHARAALQHAKDCYEWPILPETALQGGLRAFAAAFRVKYSLAMQGLRVASEHLDSAVVDVSAAGILTFMGGNHADPSVPLASLQDLDPQDATVRAALERIHNSRLAANKALEFIEWSRGHLSMSIVFLGRPGIPNAIELADREGAAAYDALIDVMLLTQAAWDQVAAARQILDP